MNWFAPMKPRAIAGIRYACERSALDLRCRPAGPVYDLCQRAAGDLLDPTAYRTAVLG